MFSPGLKFGLTLSALFAVTTAEAGTIRLNGDVSDKSVNRLIAQATELSNKGDRNITVSLNSGGGNLKAALRGFNSLRRLGVNTFAHNDCSSSCTVLFAAGRIRGASTGTTFEFHQVGIDGASSRQSQEYYRQKYANLWLGTIRSASPSLAAELERNRTLLKGRRTYKTNVLKNYGYVND